MRISDSDNVAQDTLGMVRGNIYRFDQNNGSNAAAPLSLSETDDGENNAGAPYTVGVSYWLNTVSSPPLRAHQTDSALV